jgi:drug/metabolite transporter (DMT)-like permease
MIWSALDFKGWAILFLLAAGPTLLGFGTYNLSLTYLPSSVANLIVTLEPVFTTISAYFAFGEVLTPIQLVGGLLIVGGVVVIRITEGLKSVR